MASAVDPSKPEDGQPAAKGELRANLAAAENELNHAGFTSHVPVNYNAADDHGTTQFSGIDVALGDKASLTTTVKTRTGNYTLALSDRDVYVRIDSAGAATLTVPSNTTVPLPLGTRVYLRQAGTGSVSVVGEDGVSIHTPMTLTLSRPHATAALIKVATDEWDLMGDLAAA